MFGTENAMEYLLRPYLSLLILAIVIVSVLYTINRIIPDSSVLLSGTPTPGLIIQHPTTTQIAAPTIKPHFEDGLDPNAVVKNSSDDGGMSSIFKDIGDEVERIRGLSLGKLIQPKFMSKHQFTSDVENELDEDIERLENEMDKFNSNLPVLHSFVLPGGSNINIWLHKAGTICRKAERRCVKLSKTSDLELNVIRYLNRLSDALFVWSRWVNYIQKCKENVWDPNYSKNH